MDRIIHRYFQCPVVFKIWKNITKTSLLNTEGIILFKSMHHSNSMEEQAKVSAFLISLFEIHKAYFYELNETQNISIYTTISRIKRGVYKELGSSRALMIYGTENCVRNFFRI